jgi:hypothetical protein
LKRRNLGIAAGAAAASVTAIYDLWLWLANYLTDNFHNDFTFYYAAARVGLHDGWAHLYDLHLQQQQLDAIGSHITVAQLARFVSPPPLALLVSVFTAVPYQAAYWCWSALLLFALFLAWKVTAPSTGRARVIFLVAAIGWLPVIYGLQLGQPAVLAAYGVAACYARLERNQRFEAGIGLGLVVLKPQLAFLVPPALAVAGRWRAFAGAAITLGTLAVVSLVLLGPQGISDYLGILRFATTVPENQSQTLAAWLPNLTVARTVQVIVSLWTLVLVYRLRHRDPRVWIAVALTGGLAASPYTHYDDLTMLGLAIVLYLGAPRPGWTWSYALALVIAAEGFPVWGAGPVLVGELGALVLFSVAALKHDDGHAQQHDAERQHDPDLDRDRQHLAVDGQAQTIDHRGGQA